MARKSKYKSENKAMSSTAKWKAGLYLRLSKEDGDKDDENKLESDSIYSQRLIMEDYLVENPDIQLILEYVDEGYTGTNFNRPAFIKMIDDIRVRKINCVIVKDLSRFGRNYLETGQYLEVFFPLMDIRFISVVDNIDSHLNPDSINNISFSFMNIINEEYSRDISNKIRSTFVAKRENGEYICGFALYGYERDKVNRGKLIIDPEAAKVVKQIFQWYLEGMTCSTITYKLNERGILNPTTYKSRKYSNYHHKNSNGGLWNKQSIRNILRSQMYTGDLVQGKYEKISHKVNKVKKLSEEKWVIIENHHEPIIDKDLFFKIQEILNRDTRISQKTKELSLFAGFLRCADCGRQMVKKNVNKKEDREKYHYYVCGTYDLMTKSACTRHTIRSDVLEKTVLDAVKRLAELAVRIRKIINSQQKITENEKVKKLLNEREQEKMKIEDNLNRLYSDYKNELISLEQYLLIKEKYEPELNSLNQSISNLQNTLKKEQERIDTLNVFIDKFIKYEKIEKVTRALLISLIDVIYIYNNVAVEIKFRDQDIINRAIDCANAI